MGETIKEIREKKVAIVGGSESTRDKAPYEDESWEIWGTQNRLPQYKRYDLLFEVHSPSHFIDDGTRDGYFNLYKHQINHLKAENKLIDHSNYPLDQALALRGGRWTLQGCICYMIAYAVLQDASEMALYGVDLVDNHEYLTQKPHVEGWIGYCEGRGIKITWPQESALGWYPYKYGIEPHKEVNYLGMKANPVTRMLIHAMSQCELAREKYKDHEDICAQAEVELNCYANVLDRIREAERGRDISKAISVPFDEIDKHLERQV